MEIILPNLSCSGVLVVSMDYRIAHGPNNMPLIPQRDNNVTCPLRAVSCPFALVSGPDSGWSSCVGAPDFL
jgi:hypothetical protein